MRQIGAALFPLCVLFVFLLVACEWDLGPGVGRRMAAGATDSLELSAAAADRAPVFPELPYEPATPIDCTTDPRLQRLTSPGASREEDDECEAPGIQSISVAPEGAVLVTPNWNGSGEPARVTALEFWNGDGSRLVKFDCELDGSTDVYLCRPRRSAGGRARVYATRAHPFTERYQLALLSLRSSGCGLSLNHFMTAPVCGVEQPAGPGWVAPAIWIEFEYR